MNAVVSTSWVQPVGRIGPRRVEGRDEDPFTLLVEAGERLFGTLRPTAGPEGPLPQLLLLAGDPPEGGSGPLFEAWGLSPIPVETYPPGELGSYQAIARALEGQDPSVGPTALLVAARAGALGEGAGAIPPQSAGAVGLLFGPGPGLWPSSKTGAQRAAGDPEARRKALVAALERGGDAWGGPWGAVTASGEEGLAACEDLRRTLSGGAPLPDPEVSPAGEEGEDSSLAPARALALLAHRTSAGALGMWVHARGHFVALRSFRAATPLPLEGLSTDRKEGVEVLRESFRARHEPEPAQGVSQGAYVSLPRYRETVPARWRLEGEHCGNCGGWTLPARGSCSKCGRSDPLVVGRLPRVGGLLEATTVIRPGAQPGEFDTLGNGSSDGYAVGLVRLTAGLRLPLEITDLEPPVPCPGRRVETVLRRIYYQDGSWRYGLKARLLPGAPEPLDLSPSRQGEAIPASSPAPGRAPGKRARPPPRPSPSKGPAKGRRRR